MQFEYVQRSPDQMVKQGGKDVDYSLQSFLMDCILVFMNIHVYRMN